MVKRSAVVAEPVIWRRIVVRALTVLTFFTVVFGVLYPLFITGAANLFFPHQAQGSLVEADGRIARIFRAAPGLSRARRQRLRSITPQRAPQATFPRITPCLKAK